MKLLTKKLTRAEALQYVARKIVAHPEEYEQRSFCGTACCIAGHLDALRSGRRTIKKGTGHHIGSRAEKMIGMAPGFDGLNLFGPNLYGRFYRPFVAALNSADREIKTARMGARAIKYYISKQDPKVMAQRIVCNGYDPAFGEPKVAK